MHSQNLESAEEDIKQKIKFSLSKFHHPVGEFQLFPECLKAKEYKYNEESFFVLIAQLKIPNKKEFYDVPVCIDINENESPETIRPLLYIHKDSGFINHTIQELQGKMSITYIGCSKNKCVVLGELGELNSHELYSHYLRFFLAEDLNRGIMFQELTVHLFLSTMLLDDLMYQELFLEQASSDNSNNTNRLNEINHSIYEIFDEVTFKIIMQKVNAFSLKHGYRPSIIGDDSPSIAWWDYRNKYGYSLAAEIHTILMGTIFLEFLYKLSPIELMALTMMSTPDAKANSILITTLMYFKKRSSISFTSDLNLLFRIKHTHFYEFLILDNDMDAQVDVLDEKFDLEIRRSDQTPSESDKETKNSFKWAELLLKNQYVTLLDYIKYVQPSSDKQSLENLIGYGESKTLEFKATAKYSMDAEADDKNLYYPIIKSICAFANTDGGTLVVGFHERTNEFTGIEKDGFKDTDKWENYIRNHLDQKAGKFIGTLFDVIFQSYDSKTVALINVRKSSKIIYCSDIANPKSQNFYVRTGAYTKALELEEAIEFIASHNLD
ncbi:ATP-binding protein [Gammaproteobacteria bacterium]|nr:ATP-binding protein [Gammaproteobacteria bacterium]